MPLSEHEQRVLQQMEQALYDEDPRFASQIHKSHESAANGQRKRAGLGIIVALAGLVLVVLGVSIGQIWLGGLGFGAMVVGGYLAFSSPQQSGKANLGAVQSDGSVKPGAGAAKSTEKSKKQRSGGSFMDRMEERWDKRRNEGPY